MSSLFDVIGSLRAAQTELVLAIEKQARPEQGWNIDDWARHVGREVEAARNHRDAVAQEYRETLRYARIALSDRKSGVSL